MSTIRASLLLIIIVIVAGIPGTAHAQGQPRISIGYIAPIGFHNVSQPTQTVYVSIDTQNVPDGTVLYITGFFRNTSRPTEAAVPIMMTATVGQDFAQADMDVNTPAGASDDQALVSVTVS